MRWMIVAALLVGGCSQGINGIGLTTASILSPTKPASDPVQAPASPAAATGAANQAATSTASARPIAATNASIPAAAITAPLAAPAAPAMSTPVVAAAPAAKPSSSGGGKIGVAERVSGNLFRVQPDGRRIDERIDRENYTLLRAAETTQQQGGTHFVLVSAGDQSATGMPSLQMIVSGNRDAEYGAYFRILKVEPDSTAPIGAMSADEIVHFFGPKFRGTKG